MARPTPASAFVVPPLASALLASAWIALVVPMLVFILVAVQGASAAATGDDAPTHPVFIVLAALAAVSAVAAPVALLRRLAAKKPATRNHYVAAVCMMIFGAVGTYATVVVSPSTGAALLNITGVALAAGCITMIRTAAKRATASA